MLFNWTKSLSCFILIKAGQAFFMNLLYISIIAISICVSCVCLGYLSTQVPSTEQHYIDMLMGLGVLFMAGYLLCYIGRTADMLVLGFKLQYVSSLLTFVLVFIFLTEVYNIRVFKPLLLAIVAWTLFLVAVVTICMKGSGIVLNWFYSDYNVVEIEGSRCALDVVPNWALYAIPVSMTFFMFMTLIMVSRAVIVPFDSTYRINFSLLLMVIVPQVAILCSLAQGTVKTLPVVPIVIGLWSFVSTIFVKMGRFNNLYDLAYRSIMNSSNSPLFIIDRKFNVRNVNMAASILFPEYKGLDGRTPSNIKAHLDLQNIIVPTSSSENLVDRVIYIAGNSYEPEMHKIESRGFIYGYLIILKDVTNQMKKTDELEVFNNELMRSAAAKEGRISAIREKVVAGTLQFVMDKNPMTGEHMRRTSNYTFIIAKEMQTEGMFPEILNDEYIDILCQVAPLHDVGKFLLSDELLEKKNPTESEEVLLKSHVLLGAKMIDRMIVNNSDDLYYKLAREVALYHHEKWNGQGYPEGLSGETIPLSARIVAVADMFDKLSARQASRAKFLFDEAMGAVSASSGSRFDPKIIQAFANASLKIKYLYEQTFQAELQKKDDAYDAL